MSTEKLSREQLEATFAELLAALDRIAVERPGSVLALLENQTRLRDALVEMRDICDAYIGALAVLIDTTMLVTPVENREC